MDFDDTWHPATHPSGAVLPVLTALSEALPQTPKFSGLDLLLAFNVGVEVQGRLMHFSKEAKDIPKRYRDSAHQGEPHCPLSVSDCVELPDLKAGSVTLITTPRETIFRHIACTMSIQKDMIRK